MYKQNCKNVTNPYARFLNIKLVHGSLADLIFIFLYRIVFVALQSRSMSLVDGVGDHFKIFYSIKANEVTVYFIPGSKDEIVKYSQFSGDSKHEGIIIPNT